MRKIFWLLLFLFSCAEKNQTEHSVIYSLPVDSAKSEKPATKDSIITKDDSSPRISELEQRFIAAGLVNIHSLDSSIRVDLKYSSGENFTGEDLYGDLCNCYLQKEVAWGLAMAQHYLKNINPEYSLIVFDCARPLSIQQLMWQKIPVERAEKKKYLTNPKYGSVHNYGAAVDAGLTDENGNGLDMGSSFDEWSERSHPVEEPRLLDEGKLTRQQVENRKLLRAVMYKAGFFNIQTEWWHFNYCTREAAAERFEMLR